MDFAAIGKLTGGASGPTFDRKYSLTQTAIDALEAAAAAAGLTYSRTLELMIMNCTAQYELPIPPAADKAPSPEQLPADIDGFDMFDTGDLENFNPLQE